MTDLYWALLGLSVLIIGSVLAFNWWQERKFRQETSSRFDDPQYDALMEGDEPVGRNEEFHIDPDAVRDDEEYASRVESVDASQEADLEQQVTHASHDIEHIELEEAVESAPESWQEETTSAVSAPASEPEPMAEPAPWEEIQDESASAAIITEPESTVAPQTSAPPVVTLPAEVNPEIDFIAVLNLPQLTTGRALREFLLSITDVDKPVYAYGLGGDQHWHLLTREQESASFGAAVCSLQLADRAGPVSTGTLSRFHLAVEELAQALGASIEWLNTDNPIQQATELDQFCIEVDQMVGFHLIQGASGPFTGTKFRGLAEAGGMSLGEDGAYHYIVEHADSGRQVLFSIVNQDQLPFSIEMLRTSVIRGLTFQLDIPRVQNYNEAYQHMVLLARQMEHSLGAHLVDDKQRELNDAQIDKIRQQIKLIHDKMLAHGIVPGEAYALRLFS